MEGRAAKRSVHCRGSEAIDGGREGPTPDEDAAQSEATVTRGGTVNGGEGVRSGERRLRVPRFDLLSYHATACAGRFEWTRGREQDGYRAWRNKQRWVGRCHQSFTTIPRSGSQSLVSLALEVTRDDDSARPITGGVFTLSAASILCLVALIHVLDEACDMGSCFSKDGGEAQHAQVVQHARVVQPAQVAQHAQVVQHAQVAQHARVVQHAQVAQHAQDEVARIKDLLTETAHKTPGHWDRTWYVPIDHIVKILDVKTVSALLPICAPGTPQSDYNSLAHRICGAEVKRTEEMGDAEAYDRILAILLLMGQERKLHVFMDEGMKMTNGKLPLKKGNLLLNQVEGWGSLEKHGFREQQWKVLAPVLGPETVSQTARHYEFPYDQPLPFVKMDKRQMYERQMEGSFGIVEAITIHEAHSRFSKHTKFAVKWLKSGDKDEFDREVENLERFNHSHIVKLLFTVQSVAEEDKEDKEDKAAKKKVKYLLVFPLAAGTLKDAWSHKWEGCDPKTLSEWMLEQSLGLADGLQHIHNPDLGSNRPDLGPNSYWAKEAKYGIHRDIKPTNILWSGAESSANLGTLQLADLGATSFHHTDTRSNAPGGVETKTYAPPEQELGQPKSRAFDIWSLGCVFLEFLIFIVQRTDVKDASTLAPSFSKERLDEAKRCNSAPHGIHGDAFFTVESNKWTRVARVNLAVVQRIDELFRHRECTYFVHDLLTLIQHGMLVIKAKKDDEESSLRYSIADVCKELTNMVARGKTEHGYFTDKYTPLPETKGPSQGLDGPPPPPPPPPPPESQARHPLQPKPDEEAVPQARRMQRTQHHQTPSAAKRHSGGGRTRLSPLSESAASEDALEQGGPGLNSPIRGAKQPKNTSPSQQAAGREEEHNFHPPRKQRPELTRPSPIDNPLEQTNNQKDEQPEQASDLPRKRPIDNVSEEATTREPEPLVQTPPAPRRERPPNTTPTNPLTDEPLPRSQAGATPPRAAAKGPLSGYSNMKDPSTPPVRKPGPNREKIRADAQLRLQKLQLQSGQGPGKRGPTEAPVAPRTRVTERPEKQGSRLGVSPEEVMKLRARMETNLQSLEGKKGPKQERGSG